MCGATAGRRTFPFSCRDAAPGRPGAFHSFDLAHNVVSEVGQTIRKVVGVAARPP